ncbi:MAG: hypothetical protein FWE14_11130 [Lachnospiraceae bacterium]|nr:hypothetical protein [Lachnospiraceae bacterium]
MENLADYKKNRGKRIISKTGHVEKIIEFIETHRQYSADILEREARCLSIQFPACLCEIGETDLIAGEMSHLAVGFAPQHNNDMGYYLDTALLSQFSESDLEKLKPYLDYYEKETTARKVRLNYPADIAEALPSDAYTDDSYAAYPLYRMSGAQLDFDKLIKSGIPGLMEIIDNKIKTDDYCPPLLKAMKSVLITLINVCQFYETMARKMAKKAKPGRAAQLQKMAEALANISQAKPASFHEGLQLMFLYSLLSGAFNYGRLDVYLGDLLTADLDKGTLNQEQALSLLISLFQLIVIRGNTWDARVIIGGRGRRNEKNADKVALLALKASAILKETLPQLTLRIYNGINPELMEAAIDTINETAVYPLLYNDEVNIPSVSQAFNVNMDEAFQYLPFGCGEYVLSHQSFGTPSGIINLLKCLEFALFNGIDMVSGEKRGLDTGNLISYESYEELFAAYQKQVEYFTAVLARQEALEYQIAAKEAGYLYYSLLYDSCLEREKAIFDGGIKYRGGTLESYGNTNTGDALTAIKKLIFEDKVITREILAAALTNDFNGYEEIRQLLLNAPKYGNDDDYADETICEVHNHLCKFTKEQADKVGLHNYLIVIINNSINTTMGLYTIASADGRKAYEPMANANNPSGGADQKGLPAFLNSLVKIDSGIHAGAVQNLKLSKEMFAAHKDNTIALIKTYFEIGGTQLMITVLSRGDLENVLREPEKYANVMVRVGGFCARFVDLDPKVQQEILSRTLY